MRVLFWGTPKFAVPSLAALAGEGHEVVGVVTQPDRPAGRGRKLRPSPVKELALREGWPVLTPERPRGEEFLDRLRALEPEISVVVAYGHILKPEVLELPPHGSVNVHASLLPELRGAAPIHWALIRGHEKTGVTVMRMTPGMDEGPILLQVEEEVLPDDTTSELSIQLAELGAEAIVAALGLIEMGEAEERPQDDEAATYAPKISREAARIDWSQGTVPLRNHIRGMDAVPGAWTELEGEPVKLFRPEAQVGEGVGAEGVSDPPPGTILDPDEDGVLRIATTDGHLRIGEVQPPGKRRMSSIDWLNGRGAEVGQRFE